MNLGQSIYRLRTQQHLSQSELADALCVSRQSVSKWETGSAVPDLDKLIRLSQIFGVSLDQLVQGTSAAETQAAPSDPEKETSAASEAPRITGRQLAGTLLLFFAGLVWMVLTLMGGLVTGLIVALPFLLCGLICLLVRFHPGLWCGWSLFLLVRFFMQRIIGSASLLLLYTNTQQRTQVILFLLNLLALALLLFATVRCYSQKPMANTRRNRLLLAMGWLILILLHLPLPIPWERLEPTALFWIFSALSLLSLALLPTVLVASVRLYRDRRSQ